MGARAALALVSFSVFTDRGVVGVPRGSPVEEWRISLVAGQDQAAVFNEDGTMIADLIMGFVTVVQNGLATMRRRSGIDPDLPLRMFASNGRLAAIDPLTSFDVELVSAPIISRLLKRCLRPTSHSAQTTEGE